MGIHRRKEDFLKKKKDVHAMNLLSYIKECQRSLQLLKNKSPISLGKLVITIISIILARRKITFEVPTFRGLLFSEGRYFWHLLTPVKFYHAF